MTFCRPMFIPLASLAAFVVAQITPALMAQGNPSPTRGPFQFQPLPASAPCTAGGNPGQPFLLPAGYQQTIVAREGDGGSSDNWDMNTLNETGPHAGRFLFRTHETGANASVSFTDLMTGLTQVLAARADWERFDGLVWTPHATLLAAEEARTDNRVLPDPTFPQARAGLVYEIDPMTGNSVARPAIGSRAHEGLRFDPQGNLYGISEANPGYIYRFTPDRRGDLSSGQLSVLKIIAPIGDRTGEAVWVPLDRAAVQIDSDAEAAAAGATGYNRPEDVEIASSTGSSRGGSNVLYVAITRENRVLRIELGGGSEHQTAFVSEYVRAGVNAPVDFRRPDNLALDKNGNLYIAEDPGGSAATGKVMGDDIWVAVPGGPEAASQTVRFASLTDCDGEPSGIYFGKSGTVLFVNALGRGGDGQDLAVAITEVK